MNLFGLCQNNPHLHFDTDGRFIFPLLTIVNPDMPQAYPIPSPFDQLGSSNVPLDEEIWFQENYAGWLRFSKSLFIDEINAGIDYKENFNGKSSRQRISPGMAGKIPWKMPIGGNDRLYGDKG